LDSGASGTFITLQRTGGVAPLPTPGESAGPDSRESFSIKVTPTGAEVQGRSSSAVYYGALTLIQLVEGVGVEARLPEVKIHDWPSLPYRGVMVDTSHGPLPTEAEMKRQIDFSAHWKINQYYRIRRRALRWKDIPS
jgi:N-acetyl-beta-hexosaminidase